MVLSPHLIAYHKIPPGSMGDGAEIDRDQGTPPARAGNETDLTTCSIMEVTRESEERFVTDQATYTLAGPPELRWGNLKGVSASRSRES